MTAMIFVDASLHGSSFPSTYIAPGILQWFGVSSTQGSTTGTLPASPQSGVYGSNTYTMVAGNIAQGPDADVVAGYFTATGTLTVIPVGFAATHVEIVDGSTGTKYEWFLGMAATNTIKTTTSAVTLDTTSAIVVTGDSAGGLGDTAYIVLTAGAAVNTHVISFRIEA